MKRRGLFVAAVFLLSIFAAGCSKRACFSWTQGEGACPPQDKALSFFVAAGCQGGIESVDSEGEFVVADDDPLPGDLCCYDVTETGDGFVVCPNGGGLPAPE